MRMLTRGLIAAALAFASGCASTDWIDRTLVTVDVTGTWSGASEGRVSEEMWFELKQEGSTVKGSLRLFAKTSTGDLSGPIEGTVAGDVFRFRNSRGSLEGEMTVNGDEMTGLTSTSYGRQPTSLRRVDPSSRPGPPTR